MTLPIRTQIASLLLLIVPPFALPLAGAEAESLWNWQRWQREKVVVSPLNWETPSGVQAFRGHDSLYFRVETPLPENQFQLPRLYSAVHDLWIWNTQARIAAEDMIASDGRLHSEYAAPFVPPSQQWAKLTQTPDRWTVHLNADLEYPLLVVLDLVSPARSLDTAPIIQPAANQQIVLSASAGEVRGDKLQFEPLAHKNTIGYWVDSSASVSWHFQTEAVEEFQVHVLQGCGTGQGGSQVAFDFGSETLNYQVIETGHFQNFRWREVGKVRLAADAEHTLTVSCVQKAKAAVMDIRQIRLVPAQASSAAPPQHVRDSPPDVTLPCLTLGPAAPGKRLLTYLDHSPDQAAPPRHSSPFHVVGLPTNWNRQGSFPLIVELVGNGPYANDGGDTNSGRVEDGELAWGLSGGDSWITLTVPFLNTAGTRPVTAWWGDPSNFDTAATLEYLQQAIDQTCRDFAADPERIVLVGFSRGSLACSYLGLANDDIAENWRGLLCFSHLDGVRSWPYPNSDAKSAATRWRRFAGRPVLVLNESSPAGQSQQKGAREFFDRYHLSEMKRLAATGFVNHDDAWMLRPSSARRLARDWLADCVDSAKRDDSL